MSYAVLSLYIAAMAALAYLAVPDRCARAGRAVRRTAARAWRGLAVPYRFARGSYYHRQARHARPRETAPKTTALTAVRHA